MKLRGYRIFASIIFTVLFIYSCKKVSTVNESTLPTTKPAEKKQPNNNLNKNQPENSCVYFRYLNEVQNIDTSSSSPSTSKYISAEDFFKLMENHEFNILKNGIVKNDPASCSQQCNDLNLNKIYESLIAYEILNSPELNKDLSKVTNKIMEAMKTELGNITFESSVKYWSKYIKDNKISYPSLQRKLVLDEYKYPVMNLSVTDKLKYIIGLPITNNGKNYLNSIPNVGLAFDFIATNAKKHDKKIDLDGHKGTISSIKEGPFYIKERDYFFNSIGRRLRGYRGNLPSSQQTLTDQFGISPLDVSELKAPKNGIKWTDQRTHCLTEPNSNLYSTSISKLQIPLVCGISGSTNIAATAIFVYKVDLNEDEMRKFILLTWAVLSYDTGHSLQEVLTSAKLTSIYFTGVSKSTNSLYHDFKSIINTKSLVSLQKVTKLVSPLTEIDKTVPVDLKKWEDIENKVFGSDPKDGQKHYYNEIASSEEQKSFEQTQEEKAIRADLEYYFSRYDKVKIIKYDTVFGKYYVSFFSQMKNPNFNKARKEAQRKLVEGYFNKSCKVK